MLIEIFNENVYTTTGLQTSEDSSVKRAPLCTITETGEIADKYKIVRDFILYATNSEKHPIKDGGYYMLEIEMKYLPKDQYSAERDLFEFKLEYYMDAENVVHGLVELSPSNEIVSYRRSYGEKTTENPFV